MARVAVALSCTAEQRAELTALARSRTEEARLVERAKIVLACLEGQRNDAVGREFGVRPNTVGLWRTRFAAAGLAGLRDRARPGKTPKYGAELRLRVLRQLELPPPTGLASWDGASLAAALGASDDAVWRLLCREGVQLRRRRSWCVSTDPQFATKAADIIGLYLNPPENALVSSVDEKPTIQALERARGYVLTSSGKIVHGLKSTYKRHGQPVRRARSGHRRHSRKDHADQETRRFPGLHDRPGRRATARSEDPCDPRQPLHPHTSPQPRQVGSTRWKSGSASSAERPWPEPALPASRNWSRQSATSPKPTTETPRPSSGASVEERRLVGGTPEREVKGAQLRNTIVNLRN